jgi:EAL domain-containing protein (putative c-di-GMP-specific phosphodiesterase class I)
VRFALDDFGSGLSSFAYLKSLPVDYLKIDGSFVRGIAEDKIDFAVIDAIHRLGKAAGARTIAECVESEASLERVRDLGIDCAQGHFLHRPEPYSALAARMSLPTHDDCAIHAA